MGKYSGFVRPARVFGTRSGRNGTALLIRDGKRITPTKTRNGFGSFFALNRLKNDFSLIVLFKRFFEKKIRERKKRKKTERKERSKEKERKKKDKKERETIPKFFSGLIFWKKQIII